MAETYTPGYSANSASFMARRTLDSHAAFLKPHLRPGMRVLDVGCGPGTITQGLATAVAPGDVTGLDQGESQIELARSGARAAGLAHLTFATGSVYALPFASASFDLVFAHAVFEHLREPAAALDELRRVLKPGGRIALRSPDWGGFLIAPPSPATDAALLAYRALQTANGGNVLAGRLLPAWLRAAGFGEVAATASYEIYPSPALIGEYLALQLDRVGQPESAAALRSWQTHPDALFAQAWGEATGVR